MQRLAIVGKVSVVYGIVENNLLTIIKVLDNLDPNPASHVSVGDQFDYYHLIGKKHKNAMERLTRGYQVYNSFVAKRNGVESFRNAYQNMNMFSGYSFALEPEDRFNNTLLKLKNIYYIDNNLVETLIWAVSVLLKGYLDNQTRLFSGFGFDRMTEIFESDTSPGRLAKLLSIIFSNNLPVRISGDKQEISMLISPAYLEKLKTVSIPEKTSPISFLFMKGGYDTVSIGYDLLHDDFPVKLG